jgi:hypothetical protein
VAANFNGFLQRMTGPVRLRSQLRHATFPLFTLLTSINSFPSSVSVKLSATLLGGDIFGLMSKQLRELLEVAPPVETVVNNRSRGIRQSWKPDLNRPDSTVTSLLAPEQSIHKPVGPNFHEGLFESFESRARVASALSSSEPTRESSAMPVIDRQSKSVFPLLSTTKSEGFQFISEPLESRARHRQNGNHGSPLLEKKLRQYWELAQEDRNRQLTSDQSNPAAAVSPVDHVPVPSALMSTSRAWPDFVGRETSRKAQVASSQLAGHSAKNMSQRSSEKVEIQNVFNIEVKNEPSSSRGFDDLADKIAEILNEQALQHGIDVT